MDFLNRIPDTKVRMAPFNFLCVGTDKLISASLLLVWYARDSAGGRGLATA